jgi:hypothetical protein
MLASPGTFFSAFFLLSKAALAFVVPLAAGILVWRLASRCRDPLLRKRTEETATTLFLLSIAFPGAILLGPFAGDVKAVEDLPAATEREATATWDGMGRTPEPRMSDAIEFGSGVESAGTGERTEPASGLTGDAEAGTASAPTEPRPPSP